MALLLSNIVWPGSEGDPSEALADRLGIPTSQIHSWELLKRSVDGRRRPPVWLANYKVIVDTQEGPLLAKNILAFGCLTIGTFAAMMRKTLQRFPVALGRMAFGPS